MLKRLPFIILLFISNSLLSQVPEGTWSVNPYPFSESQQIIITVKDINNGNLSGVNEIYLWTWYTKLNGEDPNSDSSWNGEWSASKESMKMQSNGDGSYSYTYTPSTFYDDTGIGTIGVVAKAKDGSGDKKTKDFIIEVGEFAFNLISPSNTINVIDSGDDVNVFATTNTEVNFELKKGDLSIHQIDNAMEFDFTLLNIEEGGIYKLIATDIELNTVVSLTFEIVIKPDVQIKSIPSGLKDGINIIDEKVIFILYAPKKDFVYLSGSFNSWNISEDYLMYYDQNSDRFWFEIESLNKDIYHSYQYIVDGSITIADPYSIMILDSYNDSYICIDSSCGFSTLPSYPTSNNHAASMFMIKDNFSWEDSSFIKPDKKDLIIYEVLLRDFTNEQSFEGLFNKLDYLQNLGINAIELMPVNEYDGNESWGYNPSFHMAIDKFYGSPLKFKKLVNECHKRGIAVLLDVVYNHASGQNPYFRLWNTKPNAYDGLPTSDNPFFQISPISESYLNYFNDINHDSDVVRDYLKRINHFLIEEYHIDGFRFDLSKGFTNETVAENYLSSRVDYLKSLADDIWEYDSDSYVVFEHFQNMEEKLFSDYGIMSWGEENYEYNEATMGYPSNFSGISYRSRNFSKATLIGFMESHDKERLMYKNNLYGNSINSYDVKQFENGIDRIKAAGALFFTIPGPKMIWQFGELGYDYGINRCEDGTYSETCRLSKKPSAFSLDMDLQSKRMQLYKVWSRLIALKKNEKIFRTSDFTTNFSSDIKVLNLDYNDASSSEISKVISIVNFSMEEKVINNSYFPSGTWYDIINNNYSMELSTSSVITLQPGEFMLIANNPTSLEDDETLLLSANKKNQNKSLKVYPNPVNDRLHVRVLVPTKYPLKFSIYNLDGSEVFMSKEFKSSFKKDIDLLKPSIYFVLVEGDGYFFKKKIIKK